MDLIPPLKKFVNIEYDTQNQQLYELWGKTTAQRVAEGVAVADLEIVRRAGYRLVLRCRENLSKFRQGDALLLNRGTPSLGGFSCNLDEDNGEELVISAGYNVSFEGLFGGGGWCLDQDKVDVRHILLGALDLIAETPGRESYFRSFVEGSARPVLNPQRLAQARLLAAGYGLNLSQTEAFVNAYAAENFYMIQGPPGTGKTWVLAYLATALAQAGERVLITAFTHRAINNALRKIARTTGFGRLLKIGQPMYADDLTWDGGGVPNYNNFAESPYRSTERGLIVGGTCFAVQSRRLNAVEFDTIIFDEASQVTLPLALAGMLAGKKYIFIGDHKQMAPVIVGKHSLPWVKQSIFEALFRHSPGTMLDTTYRMCAELNAYPSRRFYGGKLASSNDAKAKRLRLNQPPQRFEAILDPAQPDVFVEIAHSGRGMRSPEEAEAAAGIALEAVRCGLDPAEVAIVAPYRAQGRLIRNRIREMAAEMDLPDLAGIVVDTVERIQGQERELVILSLTTSDPAHAAERAEFYFQPNRLNVAITRARVKRVVLGSPRLFETEVKDPAIQEWVSNFEELYRQSRVIRLAD